MKTIPLQTADGQHVVISFIGRIVRVQLQNWRMTILEYWPVEWVTFDMNAGRRIAKAWQNLVLIMLLCFSIIVALGVLIVFFENAEAIRQNTGYVIALAAGVGTSLAGMFAWWNLNRLWRGNRPFIMLTFSDPAGGTLTIPFWVSEQIDEPIKELMAHLVITRKAGTDLTYYDTIKPFRFSFPSRLAKLQSVPGNVFYVVIIGGALLTGCELAALDAIFGKKSFDEYFAVVGAVNVLGIIVYYLMKHVFDDFIWQYKPKPWRQGRRALLRLEPDRAIQILKDWPKCNSSLDALLLINLANLMKGDYRAALQSCSQMSALDPDVGSLQLERMQQYRPLFNRAELPAAYEADDTLEMHDAEVAAEQN